MSAELTEAQREIVRLIGQGMSRHEIAQQMDIAPTTVRKAINALCERYGCQARELVAAVEREEAT